MSEKTDEIGGLADEIYSCGDMGKILGALQDAYNRGFEVAGLREDDSLRIDRLESQLAAVTEERDRFKRALERICSPTPSVGSGKTAAEIYREVAREALGK